MPFKYYISPLPLQIILRLLLYPVALIFLRPKIEGSENIKTVKGNFILASNHISEIDSGLIPAVIPIWSYFKPIFFTSLEKKEYFHKGFRGRIFYGGLLFHLLGARRVYKGLDDYRLSVENHINLLNERQSVLIFPEGKASRDGRLGRTGGGTAFLAYQTKKPIIPIKLKGIWKMSFGEFVRRKRNLEMIIGKPIFYEDLFDENFEPTKENFKIKSQEILKRVRS